MGGLSGTISASDSKLITISMWVNLPATQPSPNDINEVALLEFGNTDINLPYQISGSPSAANSYSAASTLNTKSGIFMGVNPAGTRYITAQFSAASYGSTVSDLSGISLEGLALGTWWAAFNTSTTSPPLDEWFHIFVAYDGTNPSTVPDTLLGSHGSGYTLDYATSYQTLYIFINGVNVSGNYTDSNGIMDDPPPDPGNIAGRVLAQLGPRSSLNTQASSPNAGSGVPNVPYAKFSPDFNGGSRWYDEPGNVTTLASLPIKINGTEIGLPTLISNRDQSPRARYSDVQIWFDQFIDPTDSSNLSKFISGGHPVSVLTAQSAFGESDYLHYGDEISFVSNKGTGGSVTAAGTITNYTPSP